MKALQISTSRSASLEVVMEEEDINFSVQFEFPFMEDLLKGDSFIGKMQRGETPDSSEVLSEIRGYITGWKDIQNTEGEELEVNEHNTKSVFELLTSLEKVEEIMALMNGVTTKNLKIGAKQ